jgi:hypothetical protein
MEPLLKTSIWQQFGASIDMLDNAVRACPDQLWRAPLWQVPEGRPEFAQFWYVAYHALFWLDLYLSGSTEGFAPPSPFTLDELDPAGLLPEKPYTKSELQAYLEHGRRKCQATIEALTDEKGHQLCTFPWGEMNFVELLFYNMRHVQEHAAQLNMMLGQKAIPVPRWVKKAKDKAT